MYLRVTAILLVTCASAIVAAQTPNAPSPATRSRSVSSKPQPSPSPEAATTTAERTERKKPNPGSQNVLEVFEALLDGIRAADVKLVTGIYWNSPQLVLFNNNGTVTKGWEQMRKNRESSYPEMRDVVLEVRDVRVQMMGRDGALVSCLWTQSQTYKGVPETASGRMTLVFRKLSGAWKAIHLHTSPDAPDPSRVMTSEQPSPAKP